MAIAGDRDHLIGDCDGCKGSGQVPQDLISQHELPTVLYRVVAPGLLRPWWAETEDQVLEGIEQMDFTTEDAVIHRLNLAPQTGQPASWVNGVWTQLYYRPPASLGTLTPDL